MLIVQQSPQGNWETSGKIGHSKCLLHNNNNLLKAYMFKNTIYCRDCYFTAYVIAVTACVIAIAGACMSAITAACIVATCVIAVSCMRDCCCCCMHDFYHCCMYNYCVSGYECMTVPSDAPLSLIAQVNLIGSIASYPSNSYMTQWR